MAVRHSESAVPSSTRSIARPLIFAACGLLVLTGALPGCGGPHAVQPAPSPASPADRAPAGASRSVGMSSPAGLSPTGSQERVRSAELGLKRHDLQSAMLDLQTAIQLDPSNVKAHSLYVEIIAEHGGYTKAISDLDVLKRANPKAKDVDCWKADLLAESGRAQEAVAQARQGVREDPGCWRGHLVLGMAYEAAGRLPGAVKEFQKAYSANSIEARPRLQLAEALAKSGQWLEAIQLLEPLLQKGDTMAVANYLTGVAIGEYAPLASAPAGITYLDTVLRVRPDYIPAIAARGIVLQRIGRNREAIPLLEKAKNADPSDYRVISALASAYKAIGDPTAALARKSADSLKLYSSELERARARRLDHPEDNRNNLELAQLDQAGGNSRDAFDLVREVLRTDPNNVTALALMHREVGTGSSSSAPSAPQSDTATSASTPSASAPGSRAGA